MLLFNAMDPFKTKKLFTPVEVFGITPAISAVCAIDSVVVISTVFGSQSKKDREFTKNIGRQML